MRKRKLVIRILGILFILTLTFSSVRVVFADGDIATMLSNWFDNKRAQAINEIESSLSQEQADQTARLKTEIQQAINSAERQYQNLLENEKAKRIQRLQEYTNKLIANFDVPVENSAKVVQKLDCIAMNAEIEMDIVLGKKDSSALQDCGDLTNVLEKVALAKEEVVEQEKDVESEKASEEVGESDGN